jgi:hypothetical protein
MLLGTVIVSVDLPEVAIEVGEKLVVNPLGEEDAESDTVPVKPLRALTVIVEVPEYPLLIISDVGEAEIEKSGVVTCTFTVMLCTTDPLVPVTVTGNVPAVCEAGTVIVSVEVPEPPVTEVGFSVVVHPDGKPLVARPTVPVNPFDGLIVIVVVPLYVLEVFITIGLGIAETEKSGVVTGAKFVVRGLPKPVTRS